MFASYFMTNLLLIIFKIIISFLLIIKIIQDNSLSDISCTALEVKLHLAKIGDCAFTGL